MDERDAFDAILMEFGRTIGIPDLRLDRNGRCVLLIDPDMVVTIDLEAAERRVLLYTSLGELADDRPAACAALLRANYLGGETGGAMLGLQPEGDVVTLSQWIATAGLDAAGFAAILERFVNATEAWRGRLPQLGSLEAGRASPAPAQAIRG